MSSLILFGALVLMNSNGPYRLITYTNSASSMG